MCYLIAKNIDDVGCVALKTTHGKHLSEFKRSICTRNWCNLKRLHLNPI